MAIRTSYIKTTRADKTSTFAGGIDIKGDFGFGDAVTDTLTATGNIAVSTADKLTVGGVIVPQEIVITVPVSATSVDGTIFIANDAWVITKIEEVHSVLGTDGSAVTAQVMKCTGTQAPSAGTAMTTGTFDLKGTVETVQSGTLSTTPTHYTLADGNRIAVDYTGTLTSLAGGVITIHMKRA